MSSTNSERSRFDALAPWVLAVLYVTLLLHTTSDLGYARDEGFYFQAAESYGRWLQALWADPGAALQKAAIDRAFEVNHEHPSLMKLLFSLSHLALGKVFAMEGTSFRFPGMLMAGLAIGLVYRWGAKIKGPVAGLGAAFALSLMPRFFYHAHLACFDVPIVAMWLWAAYAYHTALEKDGWTGPLVAGLAFGLALETKHNAWFLPFACGAHGAFLVGRELWQKRGLSALSKRVFRAWAAMAVLGPALFVGLWPWIWHDTVNRVSAYVQFHTQHVHYNMEFLGVNYWQPPMPRGYAWLMTAATVPTITLVLFALGLGLAVKRLARKKPKPASEPTATTLFWVIGLTINYAAWLSNETPIFGGTKHWMTAYPFLCLFAGLGLAKVVAVLRRELLVYARKKKPLLRPWARGPLPEVVVALAVLSAPASETIHSHPFGLSAYTPLVGGAPGAAALGLNRTFWGYTTGSVVGYLNDNVPKGQSVYIHDTAGQAWDMFRRDHRVRGDIHAAGATSSANFTLYHHEKHMLGQEYQTWVAYGTVRPSYVAGIDGVPVIWVYAKPRAEGPRNDKP